MLEYIDIYINNLQAKMTKAKYIEMCEQMGDEIDPDKMPPDFSDFPLYVMYAFKIFNTLPDVYSGGMTSIYVGKNYSSLNVLFDIYGIEDDEKEKVLDIITHLDNKERTKAIREAKAAAKK